MCCLVIYDCQSRVSSLLVFILYTLLTFAKMPWLAIGDGAYIAVDAESLLDRVQAGTQKVDDDIELLDATRLWFKQDSGMKASKVQEGDKFTIHETGAFDQAIPHSKCRVSQSIIDQHGMGLRATIRITPGEVIVKEKPFIIVDFPPPDLQIRQHYRDLSAVERLLFHSFKAKSTSEINHTITDIIINNVVPLGGSDGDGEPTRSGMFRFICRINHSCVPNAQWTWMSETEEMGDSST